jgi:hypothetical protein
MLRARLELLAGAAIAVAAVATAIWPTWIEDLLGLSPDEGSGATEWWLVVILAVVALALIVHGRWSLVRAQASPGTGG